MVMNKKIVTGIIFIVIALTFGLGSLNYRIGTLDDLGPALFPLMVSGALGVSGLVMLFRGCLGTHQLVEFKLKNIAVITTSLVMFAVVSEYVNMLVAIVVLVMLSALSTEFSWLRVAKLVAGLIAVAYVFKYLLGVNLPL